MRCRRGEPASWETLGGGCPPARAAAYFTAGWQLGREEKPLPASPLCPRARDCVEGGSCSPHFCQLNTQLMDGLEGAWGSAKAVAEDDAFRCALRGSCPDFERPAPRGALGAALAGEGRPALAASSLGSAPAGQRRCPLQAPGAMPTLSLHTPGGPKLAASCAFNPPPSTHTNTHPTLQRFAVTGLEAGAQFPGAARSAGRTGL